MTIIRMLCSPVAVVLAIATCAAGAPVQIQDENIGLNNAVYSQPELAEALARTYEAMGVPAPRNLDPVGGPHRLRQPHRSLESLSGPTFDEGKRFEHAIQNNPYKQNFNREAMMNRVRIDGSAKRNFDEIDRTNFDSFVKRNFDEIDRSDFDSFVKRSLMDAYLAARQR